MNEIRTNDYVVIKRSGGFGIAIKVMKKTLLVQLSHYPSAPIIKLKKEDCSVVTRLCGEPNE